MESFYARVVGLISQLKYHGETIEDQRVFEKILRILPPRFKSLVVTLEENKDMMMFTIDELQDSLINHERIISRTNTSLEAAFSPQSSISCGRVEGRNNSRGRGRNFPRGRRSSSPVDVTARGHNQNPSPPTS